MTEEQVLAVISAAVVDVLEVPLAAVTRNTSFVDDLGADSLALIQVIEAVEEALRPHARPGFRIDDDDLDDLVTVGDAVDYALARL